MTSYNECWPRTATGLTVTGQHPANPSMTPLTQAACSGHDDCVRACMGMPGADVNAEDHHGATPMSIAAAHDRARTVRFLATEFNADLHKTSTRKDAAGNGEWPRASPRHRQPACCCAPNQAAIPR